MLKRVVDGLNESELERECKTDLRKSGTARVTAPLSRS